MTAPGAGDRSLPNILVCGTPGSGKSTLAAEVASKCGLKHIDVSAIATEKELNDGWDEERNCAILDDDKVLDEIETDMDNGGNVVDYHGAEFFPERWFDLVLVLRVDTAQLFDRLTARGYPEAKVKENVECEIFGVLSEEAKSAYSEGIVHEINSNTSDDMASNIDLVCEWLQKWKK